MSEAMQSLGSASTVTQAPAAAPPPTLATMNVDQISAGLRDNSINGLQRGDALTRLASLLKGETPAAEQKLSIQQMPTAADQSAGEAQAAANLGAIATGAYAPAKSAADYIVPISHSATQEEMAADSAFRQAFHASELPTITANAVGSAIDHAALSLKYSDDAQLQTFANGEAAGLQQLWGAEFSKKVQAVDGFLDSTADRVPLVAAILADPRARYYLADRRVVTALSQMIEARAHRG